MTAQAPGTSTSSRARQKEATADALVRAAYRRFCRKGIAATRIGDVAAAASVAHGTAFLHFPTRDQLVAAVIKRHAGQIALRLNELVGEGAGVREVLNAHVTGLREQEAFYARLVAEGPLLGEVARTTLLGIHSAVSHHLAEAAEREIAAGRVRPIDPAFLFNLWIGLVHRHVLDRALFAPGGSVLDRCGPDMIEQFMKLLSNPTGTETP